MTFAARILAAAFALATVSVPAVAHAQERFPSKPIRILVGFPAGGGVDLTGRVLAQHLAESLGQPVIVENKPGAAGVIAAQEVAKAPPDGHTLLVANLGTSVLAPNMMTPRPYDPVKDFTAIGQAVVSYFIAAVPANHPARTLTEFVAWAKKNTGKVNFASAGNASSSHLNGEILNQIGDLKMSHVPYKGAPAALTGLIAGDAHILIDLSFVLRPQVKAGKIRALAVTNPTRDPELPDVPTVREEGFVALETAGWHGLVGPAGMPKDIVARLAGEMKKVLARPDVRERFQRAGQPVFERGPEEFAAFIKSENERWATVIKTAGARID
jgi:tripartite-type tricarboxylate transporter receptor subunit TctC